MHCLFSLIEYCKYKTYFEFYASITLLTSWDKESKKDWESYDWWEKKTTVQIFHR